MGSGGGACALCPPVRSRRRRHGRPGRDSPVQWCSVCHAHVCGRHLEWIDDRYMCARCARLEGR